VSNFDVFETRLLANRMIADCVVGYEQPNVDLAWNVLDNVLPYIEDLEAQVSRLAYTLEVLNEQTQKDQSLAQS
jgi:hypothetical protein